MTCDHLFFTYSHFFNKQHDDLIEGNKQGLFKKIAHQLKREFGITLLNYLQNQQVDENFYPELTLIYESLCV